MQLEKVSKGKLFDINCGGDPLPWLVVVETTKPLLFSNIWPQLSLRHVVMALKHVSKHTTTATTTAIKFALYSSTYVAIKRRDSSLHATPHKRRKAAWHISSYFNN
jgi:hypothetical protein